MADVLPDYDALKPCLLEILERSAVPVSEYELLKMLPEHCADFPTADFGNYTELFQRHFVLFHCLYRLQQDCWSGRRGNLEISALSIRLWPYRGEDRQGVCPNDPLRDYYLNIDNLRKTDEQDIAEMLTRFWQRLNRQEGRHEALSVLGLADPVNNKTIKQRYRELVMEHHPDRGGDTARIQALNAAVSLLLGDTST